MTQPCLRIRKWGRIAVTAGILATTISTVDHLVLDISSAFLRHRGAQPKQSDFYTGLLLCAHRSQSTAATDDQWVRNEPATPPPSSSENTS